MTRMVRPVEVLLVETELLGRLEAHLRPYRVEFRRLDQLRRAAAYLMGLLRSPARKNVENLARVVAMPDDWGVTDVSQALQHFINQSPWDEDQVVRLYLRQERARMEAGGVYVVSEQTFVKQGQHSVGVQRQYSNALGRKVNCQLAMAVHHLGPESFTPLGARLYLPRGWVQDAARLRLAGVPEEAAPATKSRIALELLDRVQAEGWPRLPVVRAPCAALTEEFREGLQSRELDDQGLVAGELARVVEAGERRLFDGLGLGHFEGRSWRGFHHHACMVLLAHAFPVSDDCRGRRGEEAP